MGRGRRCRDLREGDRIHVYSAGHRLDGKGVFIRFLEEEEEDFLYWIDHRGNKVFTSLDAISIVKLRECCEDDFDERFERNRREGRCD